MAVEIKTRKRSNFSTIVNNNNRIVPSANSIDSNSAEANVEQSITTRSNENSIVESLSNQNDLPKSLQSHEGKNFSLSSIRDVHNLSDLDSLSTICLDQGSSYLKLKPFYKLDPALVRLIRFLNCFGLTINLNSKSSVESKSKPSNDVCARADRGRHIEKFNYSKYLKILLMTLVVVISGEVVYDINLRQSKLLAEQKRSTPLLTFVIVAYSWLSVVIPILSDVCLVFIGSLLLRFYSRTTATVCNGIYFGKRASVDSWYYYLALIMIAFVDSLGQMIVLGVWPPSLDPYMRMIILDGGPTRAATSLINLNSATITTTATTTISNFTTDYSGNMTSQAGDLYTNQTNSTDSALDASLAGFQVKGSKKPLIRAYILDYLLGERQAHGDLGFFIKLLCLMIQFIHSYAFFIIIISLAHHYASAINDINDNLDKYQFRRLLKQLIILRDSSEQISLIISLPFSWVIVLVFMRQIALNGVIIQSTMLPYENFAVSLQSFTCTVSIIMVFIYCDGLQSASRQTHRLKTEHSVINENKGGNQSIYEFLDYLNRLSKSIRISFFNIIAINKSSLVGLFGHILTLTFVTS